MGCECPREGTFRAAEELCSPYLGNGTNTSPTRCESSWHSAWHPRGQETLVHSELRGQPSRPQAPGLDVEQRTQASRACRYPRGHPDINTQVKKVLRPHLPTSPPPPAPSWKAAYFLHLPRCALPIASCNKFAQSLNVLVGALLLPQLQMLLERASPGVPTPYPELPGARAAVGLAVRWPRGELRPTLVQDVSPCYAAAIPGPWSFLVSMTTAWVASSLALFSIKA